MNLNPERQRVADEARKRAVLPGIEAVKQLIIPGEPCCESGEEGEDK